MAKSIGNITSIEYVVLRAYALGMGELQICQLTHYSPRQLLILKQALFKKLEVENVYYLILKAKQTGVLEATNSIDETTKTKTLAFIEKHASLLKTPPTNALKMQWYWYRMFLSYLVYLAEEQGLKKIPPKRDSRLLIVFGTWPYFDKIASHYKFKINIVLWFD